MRVRPRRNGQPASFPKMFSMPNIWDSRIEMVMISW